MLLKDVMRGEAVNPDSIILKGAEQIKTQGRWATHSYLKEIAAELEVNLHVVDKENGVPVPEYQTITLNNERNAHWTTRVDQLPKAKPKEHVSPPKPQSTHVKRTSDTAEDTSRKKTKKEEKEEPHITPSKRSIDETVSSRKRVKTMKEEPAFPVKEEQIITANVSAKAQQDKAKYYRKHLEKLVHAASTQGLFANVKNKIYVNAIDTAEADKDESDEDFAARLQEAELRRVMK
ncbi:MAG: hypothetical protein ACRCXC_03280 [Legionella sp.]